MCLSYDYNLEHRLRRKKMSKANHKVKRFYFLVVCLFIIILTLSTRYFFNHSRPQEGVIIKTRIVEAGDTLWAIAQSSGLKKDTRELVFQIMKLNSLNNDSIQPGQVIYVPVAVSTIASR